MNIRRLATWLTRFSKNCLGSVPRQCSSQSREETMGTTVNAAVNAGGSAPPATPAPTPAVTTAAPPKVSWLKHVGQFLGKVLGIVAKDAKPIADTAATVTEALYPQFAPEISAADNLVTNIAKEALGKVLGIVAKDAKPIADTAATVTEALYPQFAPEISAADNLVTNIAKEAL